MKRVYLFLVLTLIALVANAQQGFLRGNIADGDFGGPMIAAAITIPDKPGVGTTSDFDGNYSLSLDPGTYTVAVSFISYATQSFQNIEIKSGEVTMLDAVMTSMISELAAVEITAEVRRNNEVAMLLEMKNATNVSDGLSSQSFRKIGDSDLSGAIKRVTGVTVQNGKYVYVRGLGDRYTKTTLNGMNIPGLDPDVNAVQIDIFPTNVLENVNVFKTFSPDLYGDFTGGLVNVVTKSFPDEKITQLGVGLAVVPGMTFNKDYILYDRGSLDWLGYDDGTRKLPFEKKADVPSEVLNDPKLEDITRSFNPQLAVKKKTALPNGSFLFNHGNQITRESGLSIGYNAVVNYSNEYVFYRDFESNEYLRDNDQSETRLVVNKIRKGNVGKNSVLWSGLLSGSVKKGNHELMAMFLNTQNGESTASNRKNQDLNQNQAVLIEDILTYSQRTLSTFMLEGKHRISILDITWNNTISRSRVYDPDFRETRIYVSETDTNLSTGNGSGIDRFWRDLHELNESSRLDFKLPLNETINLKFGGASTLKWRDFGINEYKITRTNISDIEFNPDWFLEEQNIWSLNNLDSAGNPYGTFTIGSYQESDQFSSRQNIHAGYLMLQHPIFKRIKLIYGVRVEKTDMFYTGVSNTNANEKYSDEKTLDALNILPSFNAVLSLSEKMNVRLAANRTLARPSFKEKSVAQIYDPITKRTFIGNLNLQQTDINNYDLRYEFFITPRELFSVAAFYKQFDGHIELVPYLGAPDNLKPRNSGKAEVYGLEFEIRKALTNNTENKQISRFFFGFNATGVKSQVDMTSVNVDDDEVAGSGSSAPKTEYELRELNLRAGEKLSKFRPMSGQSPYALNASVAYEIPESKTNLSLAYNVQGEQLTIIASGRIPDVYTIPFHSLNFNAYRSFGQDFQHQLTFGVQNLLDDDRTLVYRAYQEEDHIYTTYKPGRSFRLRYTYTF